MSKQNETNETSKASVISIWSRLTKAQNESQGTTIETETQAESFVDIMRKNEQTQKRLQQERLKANQQVLKSYKIKT